MTTLAQDRPLTNGSSSAADKPIVLKRRTIDSILIGVGAVLTVALVVAGALLSWGARSEEHTSELQSLMRISYAVFCLKKKIYQTLHTDITQDIHKTSRPNTK